MKRERRREKEREREREREKGMDLGRGEERRETTDRGEEKATTEAGWKRHEGRPLLVTK